MMDMMTRVLVIMRGSKRVRVLPQKQRQPKPQKHQKNQSCTQNRPTHLQEHLKPQKTFHPLQLYLSELPIEQRFNLPSTIKDQDLFNLTPAALAIPPKPRVSKHRSLEVSNTKPIAEAPKAVQTSQAKTSDPFEELLKMKKDWIASPTIEKKIKE